VMRGTCKTGVCVGVAMLEDTLSSGHTLSTQNQRKYTMIVSFLLWGRHGGRRSGIPPVPMALGKVDPFENQRQLGQVPFYTVLILSGTGKRKLSGFETFVPQAIPTRIPVQNLDPIPTPIEEDKQMAVQRVLMRHRLGRGGQPIEASPHIRGGHTDKNPNRPPPGQHGAPNRDTNVETPWGSKFCRSRTWVRLGRTIS